MAALLAAAGAATQQAVAAAEEALATKALTVEEAQERRARLAKMRSLLFYHELKARRLKAIKSKDHHRRAAKVSAGASVGLSCRCRCRCHPPVPCSCPPAAL